MRFLPIAFVSLFASALPAQLFVVDPLGGGTHTDLQTAIDAAPAGAVIHVRGGSWGPLSITRSLTIVGENTPQVHAPYSGLGSQPAAITLQGSGTDTAVLAGLDVHGDADGYTWNHAGPGLTSAGFRRVAIHDCTVRGHDWDQVTGLATGASGIVVADAATLHVARSLVAASEALAGMPFTMTNAWAPDGAAGIAAPLADVVLLDTTVNGGSVGYSWWGMGVPWPTPCPCGAGGVMPGRGGDGVVAQNVFRAGGAVTPGAGSPTYIGMPPMPYGSQPPGTAVVATTEVTVAPTLAAASPLRLGAVHTITFAAATVPSLFVLGAPLAFPTSALGMQYLFVDATQPLALNFLLPSATSFALGVPANPQLLGIELAAQRIELTGSGPWVASSPTLAVVLP